MQTTIVTCPNCTTRFVAPTEKLQPEGRQVRCSNCRHTWFYVPSDGEDGFSSTREGVNGDAAVSEKPRRQGFFTGLLFWLIMLGLLAAILGYAFRDQLVARIPALAPAYAAIDTGIDQGKSAIAGVVSPAASLRIESTKYDIRPGEGDAPGSIIVLSGVHNGSDTVQPVPSLEVRMMGEDGAQLLEGRIEPDARLGTELQPDERRSYQAEFPAPEGEVTRVLVELAAD